MKILLIFKDWHIFQVTIRSTHILNGINDCMFIAAIIQLFLLLSYEIKNSKFLFLVVVVKSNLPNHGTIYSLEKYSLERTKLSQAV